MKAEIGLTIPSSNNQIPVSLFSITIQDMFWQNAPFESHILS